MIPEEAHKDERSMEVKANTVLKEKHLRRYPKVEVGDEVKVLDKGKGKYTSRKETRSQWPDRIYEVKEVKRDPQLDKLSCGR